MSGTLASMITMESTVAAARRQAAVLARLAKEEDLGEGDITSGLLDRNRAATFYLTSRAAGVLAGCEIAPMVLAAYDDRLTIEWADGVGDGCRLAGPGERLGTVHGPLASVLAAERPLLNFLQRLSGIATLTRRFVEAVEGTEAHIYDTRKTTPGWRVLEKYAVMCGGGRNHRSGLHDAILIKDNHISELAGADLAGAIEEMLAHATSLGITPLFVGVEADDLRQVDALLTVGGIDVILLDNFDLADLRQAVLLRDSAGLRGKVRLEASGGVTLANVRAIAETGVERISVGAITHSAPALDLGLDA